jgi:hypothetical protein
VDELRHGRADAVGVGEPVEKVGAGFAVAMGEVAGDGVGGAARELAEGGGIEKGPVIEGREFGTNGVEGRQHQGLWGRTFRRT